MQKEMAIDDLKTRRRDLIILPYNELERKASHETLRKANYRSSLTFRDRFCLHSFRNSNRSQI